MEEIKRKNSHEIRDLAELIKKECNDIFISVVRAAEEEERLRLQQQVVYENKLKSLSQQRDREREEMEPHQSLNNIREREFKGGRNSTNNEKNTTRSNRSSGIVFAPEMLSPEETEELVKSILQRSATASVSVSMSSNSIESTLNKNKSNFNPSKFKSFTSLKDNHSSNENVTNIVYPQTHRYPLELYHSIESMSHHEHININEDQSVGSSIQSIPSQSSSIVNKTLEGKEKILKLIEKLDNLTK